ncbi:hypothetical protein HDU67_002110 [Dinochytrium kinnereticum]|nr:hypothetical protein HDU67_002110 [Dinochytrium kinnereticum]
MNNLNYKTDVRPSSSQLAVANDIVANGKTLLSLDYWTVISFNPTFESNGRPSSNTTEPPQGGPAPLRYSILRSNSYTSSAGGGSVDSRDFKNPKLDVWTLATQFAVNHAILSYARDPTPGANISGDKSTLKVDFFKGSGNIEADYFDFGSSTRLAGSNSGSSSSTLASSTFGLDLGNILLKPILAVSFIPIMVIVLEVISKEKQRKLIGALRRMGLKDSIFWFSLIIPLLPICLLASLSGAMGVKIMASKFAIFDVVRFEVVAIMNFCYAVALMGLGIVFSAVVSRPVVVNVIVGVTSAAAVVVNFAVFIPNDSTPFSGTWFDNINQAWAKALLYLFAPFFNYGKVWHDIYLISLPNILNNQTQTPFTLPTFISPTRVPSIPPAARSLLPLRERTALASYETIDTPFQTSLHLLTSILVFSVAAWYLNQVVPSLEGFSRPWFFPFSKSYWTGRAQRKGVIVEGDTLALEKEKSVRGGNVRIVKLSKQYKGNTAVKEFSGVFESGKVYAVLGHNGAGKTTLINMLSLVTTPTHGDCFMFGYDIHQDIQSLQSIMSLCPQFDALYPALTAYQHVEFYANFLGREKKGMKEFITEVIEKVGLGEALHRRVGGFSGGMKRRLSLALATVSERSRIVFLDEPTTGLDPLSRRKVWKVIQELKQNRVVVLTTHSMEEADELGDQICIMHQGRLRASGSSLFLKNRFGKGYQLTIVNRKQSPSQKITLDQDDLMRTAMEKYVKYALPGADVVSSAAGAVTVAVGKGGNGRLAGFLRKLREERGVEWGISSSTLEEVFLKLCADNKPVTSESETDTKPSDQPRLCTLCATRPSEIVTLYTKSGIQVTIPHQVCAPCANGETKLPDSDHSGEGDDSTLISFEEFLGRLPPEEVFKEVGFNAVESGKEGMIKVEIPSGGILGRQVMAVVLKNLKLHAKERRTNWCFVIAVVLLNIAADGKFGAAFDTLSSRPDDCKDFVFGYNALSCTPNAIIPDLRASLFDAPTLLSTSTDRRGNAQRLVMGKGGRRSYDNAYESIELTSRKTGYQNIFGTTRRRIYYSQSAGDPLETVFPPAYSDDSIKDPFKLPFNNINSTLEDTLPYLIPRLVKVDGTTVVANALRVQRGLDQRRADLPRVCLDTFPGRAGKGVVVSADEFPGLATEAFPDYGIDVRDLRVGAERVSAEYSIVTYVPQYTVPPFVSMYSTDPAVLSFSSYGSRVQENSKCAVITMLGAYKLPDNLQDIVATMTDSLLEKIPGGRERVPAIQTFYGNRPIVLDPSEVAKVVSVLVRSFSIMFLLLATGIMYPRMVTLLVLEKRENLVEMMRTQGLGLFQYWLGNYVYAFLAIMTLNLLYFFAALILGNAYFAKVGYLVVFGCLLLWTHGQVCLAGFLIGIVNKPVSAGMVAYLVHIGSAIASPFLLSIADKNGALPIGYSLFPPTGITNILNILIVNKNPSLALLPALVVLFGSAALGLVGCYLHAIRPSPVGIPVHPLLGLEKLGGKRNLRDYDMDKNDVESVDTVVDEDVLAEKRAVAASQLGSESVFDPHEAVRIVNLRKRYPGKLAVDDISLSIKYGETFGLLGPNGAGKTTTLSMITGLLQRTSGSISIGGKDIDAARSERGGSNSLWRLIGVTPQFDTVWSELTVEEHLTFYCRLRGVPARSLTAMVRRIAEDVELDGDALRTKAGGLSGGMKRRLSIGIALTANPKILVLDEPTTGLDPETRRQIWKIVDGIRRSGGDRCVLITTHSMEEADALCSRIGIVCDGNLRVLGSQLHLKKKFGNGLKLTMRIGITATHTPTSVQDLSAPLHFLEHTQSKRVQHISEAILKNLEASQSHSAQPPAFNLVSSDMNIAHVNAMSGGDVGIPQKISWMVTLTCVMPRSGVDVAEVFLGIEQTCRREDVGDWALTETTLEDVFVKVASDSL